MSHLQENKSKAIIISIIITTIITSFLVYMLLGSSYENVKTYKSSKDKIEVSELSNQDQKMLTDEIITALNHLEPTLKVKTSGLTPSNLSTTIEQCLDNSLYKYLMSGYTVKKQFSTFTVTFKWLITPEQLKEVNSYVKKVVLSNKETDIESRLLYYANTIIKSTKYSEQGKNGIDVHSPYSLVTNKIGVCQAYSLLYKFFLDYEGIENYLIEGKTNQNHLWNLVKLDSQYYHIDITYMNNTLAETKDTYFLLSDIQLSDRKYKLPNDIKANSLKYTLLNKNYLLHDNEVNSIISLDKDVTNESLSKILGNQVDDFQVYPINEMYKYKELLGDDFPNNYYFLIVKYHNSNNIVYHIANIN